MSASLVERTAAIFKLFRFLKLTPAVNGPAAPEPFPDVEHSPYTPLHVKPGHQRKLSSITCVQSLCSTIENYFTKYPNIEKFAPFLQSLALPLAAPIALRHPVLDTRYTDFNPFIINSPNDVITLLHRFLLRSVCQILRVLDSFGDTADQDWTFTTIPCDSHVTDVVPNPDLIVLHPRSSSDNVRLVILPFTPWEFSKQDFKNLTSYPIRKFDNSSSKWTKYDKVWAYLYDICFDLKCPFFVITSYERWCFGYFSQDYSTIQFAPVISYDYSPVTVLQMLIYWIQNNFGIDQTIRSENRKRLRAEDSLLPEVKRQRIVHEILEADTTEAWGHTQEFVNLGSRFGPGSHYRRRAIELRRIEYQKHHQEASKHRRKATALTRKAKKAEKMKLKIAQAERAKKIVEIRMVEESTSIGKAKGTSIEVTPDVDEIKRKPRIAETRRVEGTLKVEAAGEASSIGGLKEEAIEKIDMISWLKAVEGDGMQICEEVVNYALTNGQSGEADEADEKMMVEEANMKTDQIKETEGVMNATEEVNEPEGPKTKEETVSNDSDSVIDIDEQSLKTVCESWQTKVRIFTNTKNEYIHFEQPDSGLVMFGDIEDFLGRLHPDYDKEPTLEAGTALSDCSEEDWKMYHKMEILKCALYRANL